MFFNGEYLHKIDSKGRVSVPAGFRPILAANDPDFDAGCAEHANPRLVLVYGPADKSGCLSGYSVSEHNKLIEKIRALPLGHKSRAALENLYITKSHSVHVDPNGRFVLNQKIRDSAAIKDLAWFEGCGATFLLKNAARHEETQKHVSQWLEDMDEDFDPLSILQDIE